MTFKIFVQESLAKSDSILIQKYVNLYKQVTALKQELKQPPIPPTPVEVTPTQKIKQVSLHAFYDEIVILNHANSTFDLEHQNGLHVM